MRSGVIAMLLIVYLPHLGCGDPVEPSEPRTYDDPAGGHGPPDFDRYGKAGKADGLNAAPRIVDVKWSPTESCRNRGISQVEIKVKVEDPDTDIEQLRFNGSVTGCDAVDGRFGPMIVGSETVLRCHHVSSHTGLITVMDPDGHGDSIAFRFGPCDEGRALGRTEAERE